MPLNFSNLVGEMVENFPYRHCKDRTDDMFPPEGGQSKGIIITPEIERAKAICNGCPHLEPCLEFAINTRQQYGIWGGTTEVERRKIRRSRQRRVQLKTLHEDSQESEAS